MERCAICSAPAVHHVQAVTGTTDAQHGMWLCDNHARELKADLDRRGEGWETDIVTGPPVQPGTPEQKPAP